MVTNPDFYPNIPTPAALAGFQSTQVIQEISSRLRAPYILQSAVTVERQLPRNTTLAVTYTNSHGLHVSALGRHQRAAAGHVQSGRARTAASFRWDIPARWT